MITVDSNTLDFLLSLKQQGFACSQNPDPYADYWWYCRFHKGFHPGHQGEPEHCDLERMIDEHQSPARS